MPTMKLVASAYQLSNTQYLNISNAANMYTDCSSTSYATVNNTQTGTTSYYLYIRGFDFSSLPAGAVVSSWVVRLKASESGGSTSSSYAPKLCNGTSQITSTMAALSTTATTREFTGVGIDWATAVGYGTNFGIRINCRRASRNTAARFDIYGAEIEVTYTVPNPRSITTALTGNGTISPSGTNTYYDGDTFELTITPANTGDQVTAAHNGADVTSQLVAHGSESSASTDLGSYALVSGGFNWQGASYFSGLVGAGVNHSQTTSNYYSSGSGQIAVFTYDMGITVPSGATITRVWCEVNGHAESTSNSSEYMCAQLISGSTNLSAELNFKDVGTSNSTQTLEATTLPTVSQLAAMKLQCRLGYYGGAINGATAHVEYETGDGITHYTYSFEVTGDATIAVVIGGASGPELYVKAGGAWTKVVRAYRKVAGSWQQVAVNQAFTQGTKYIKG